MLIAISSSQGAGKTTTLAAINEAGYNVIERKTSRSILSEWGVTLQEVNTQPELTKKFQQEITMRKFMDEAEAIKSNNLWFTERTHMDLFTYSLVALGNDNKFSEWLDNYYEISKDYTELYEHTFYLKGGHFDVEHDGTRGSNSHYSRMVDVTMLDFTQQVLDNNKLTIIDTPSLEERIKIIIGEF